MENEIVTPIDFFKDTRPDEKKADDFTHEDILAGSTESIVWKEKPLVTIDPRFQINSTSCLAQSGAKFVTTVTKVVASALPPFSNRSNFPKPNMYMQEIGSLLRNLGTDTEARYPSQYMTDEQLNAMRQEFKNMPFKIGGYYNLPAGNDMNMDLLAQALEKGHGLIIGVNSNADEWSYVPVVNGKPTFSHATCCHSNNYTLVKGEKAIGVDDSANHYSSIKGQRLLTESFLRARCWGVLALIPLAENSTPEVAYHFTVPLDYGLRNNTDVKALQKILIKEGFLTTITTPTGNYLKDTRLAVKKLQEKYADEILKPLGLSHGTGRFGTSTMAFINNKYK